MESIIKRVNFVIVAQFHVIQSLDTPSQPIPFEM